MDSVSMVRVQSATQMTSLRPIRNQAALTVRSPMETVSVNLASRICLASRVELRLDRITEVTPSRTSPTVNSLAASKTTRTTKTNRKRAKRSSNKLQMATTPRTLMILSLSNEADRLQCYQSDTLVYKSSQSQRAYRH